MIFNFIIEKRRITDDNSAEWEPVNGEIYLAECNGDAECELQNIEREEGYEYRDRMLLNSIMW